MDIPIPAFYCCYLLRSCKHRSFYIGSTPNARRRLRQHNGLEKGGAVRTNKANLRPWEMIVMVSGFPSRISALQFEWAWNKASLSHHVDKEARTRSPTTAIKGKSDQPNSLFCRLKDLQILLTTPYFQRWPLDVKFLAEDVLDSWQEWYGKSTRQVRQGINVAFDPGPDTSDLQTSLKGLKGAEKNTAIRERAAATVEAMDFGYLPLKDVIKKSRNVEQFEDQLHCAVCSQSVSLDEDLAIICPSPKCQMVSHLDCLSRNFLSLEGAENAMVPTQGQCPKCKSILKWSDLVRVLSLRIRGQTHVEKLMKRKRRKKGDPLDDPDPDGLDDPGTAAASAGGVGLSLAVSAAKLSPARFRKAANGLVASSETADDNIEETIWHDISAIESGSETEKSVSSTPRSSSKLRPHAKFRDGRLPLVIEDSEFEDIDDVL